ncbi:MAG: hypothetical protein RMK29_06455 [Myxococcales bacterium]|nr:hypothetical protein [Myxococcota bacterium]MDW8281334.1 hypothetical protein [Myxococcales bacterium]
MLCSNCYDEWLRTRPVGLGARCQSCGDRRRVHLRHFELQRGFVVLCHNCTARAQALPLLPRSPEGLLERLQRERRCGERRRLAQGPQGPERRVRERRLGARDALDVTEFAVEELDAAVADSEVTRIHCL